MQTTHTTQTMHDIHATQRESPDHRSARRVFRRSVVAVAALLVVVPVLLPGTATAAASTTLARHLRLLRSFPAADTVLSKSPDAVRLWLSESAEVPSTKVTLARAGGAAVRLGAVRRDAAKGSPLVAAVPTALAPGRYSVAWRTMSKDGHVVKGAFAFHVGAAK